MDTPEHRRQYTERIERAAEEQREGLRDFSDRSSPAEERQSALRRAVALRGQDEVAEAVDVILDREEDPTLRASALRAIGIEVGKSHDLIDMVIGLLRDGDEPEMVRQAALRTLQQSSFRAATFNPKMPEYTDALRTVIDDPEDSLREQALEILAQGKDEYAQRRLLESLEDPSQALVSPGRPCSCSATTSMPTITLFSENGAGSSFYRGEAGSRSPPGGRPGIQRTARGHSQGQERIQGGEKRQRGRASVAGSGGVPGARQADSTR